MTNNENAANILRRLKQQVDRLQQSVSTDEGLPNLLRQVSETMGSSDSVTTTVTTIVRATWDDTTATGWDNGRWGQ